MKTEHSKKYNVAVVYRFIVVVVAYMNVSLSSDDKIIVSDFLVQMT